jgi:hypothetical protein
MNIEYEIILVDHRRPDSSWEKRLNSTQKNLNIKGLILSKNFDQNRITSIILKAINSILLACLTNSFSIRAFIWGSWCMLIAF